MPHTAILLLYTTDVLPLDSRIWMLVLALIMMLVMCALLTFAVAMLDRSIADLKSRVADLEARKPSVTRHIMIASPDRPDLRSRLGGSLLPPHLHGFQTIAVNRRNDSEREK